MSIYLVIDETTHVQSITASYVLATTHAALMRKKGHKMRVLEGELKTQGKNFASWAQIKNNNVI